MASKHAHKRMHNALSAIDSNAHVLSLPEYILVATMVASVAAASGLAARSDPVSRVARLEPIFLSSRN